MNSSTLTIAIDTRGLEENFRSHFGRGTGRYVKEVLPEILKLAPEYNITCVPVGTKDLNLSPLQKALRDILPAGRVTFESQFALRGNLNRLKVDMAHFFFHGDAPAFPGTPQVVSVLDLIPLKFPDLYQKGVGGLRYQFARYLENHAIRAACGIIAISEATKRDVVELLGLSPDMIEVVPLGVNETFFPTERTSLDHTQKLLKRANKEINGSYISSSGHLALYTGGIDSRKNIPFLIELIEACNKDSEISKHGGLQLVLAGNYAKDDQLPGLIKLIEKKELKDKVILAGYLEESVLLDLFELSDIFLFPSLYEGFGLPVLESMARRLPVVAGKNSSIPEVVGDDSLLCKDLDIRAWLERTKETLLLSMSNQERLQSMLDTNEKRARSFTWKKTAEGTLNAYRKFSSLSIPA